MRAIDADALDKKLGDCIIADRGGNLTCQEIATNEAIVDTMYIVHDMPTIEPERKKGKWKHMGGDEWCCNQCGNVISTDGSWEHPLSNDRKMYHCNICGADMRGEWHGKIN